MKESAWDYSRGNVAGRAMIICRARAGGVVGIVTLLMVVMAMTIGCSVAVRPEAFQNKGASTQGIVAPPPGRSLADLVPPQSLPARGEELWIIEKPAPGDMQATTGNDAESADRSPGGGMLLSVHGATLTPLPLEKTDVHANITGLIATVDVKQHFSNSAKEPADIVYAFPLPQNAAVNEFILSIGKRHIRAIVRERAEAEQIFREARKDGLLVSLMVQPGPNIFLQRAANLEPGVGIDVELRFFHTLSFRDGWFEYEFPMLAGLRGTRVPRPPQRSGRNIALTVHLDEGMSIEAIECQTHKMAVKMGASASADVTLEAADEIPNRDLVLRFKLAGSAPKISLATQADGDGGIFALTLIPPAKIDALPRRNLEMIFVLDANVAASAQKAANQILGELTAEDTVKIIRLENGVGFNLTPRPFPAVPAAVVAGVVNAGPANPRRSESLADALGGPGDPTRTRIVCLLTDGRLPLAKALSAIPRAVGRSRLAVVGVGNSPDRNAIEAIARAVDGMVLYLPLGNDAEPLAKNFVESLGHPAMADMRLDWQGTAISDVFPHPPTDLLVGHPLLLIGHYKGPPPDEFRIHGKLADEQRIWKIQATRLPDTPGHALLASIWARRKIADLGSAAATQPNPALDRQVRDLALEYGLVSRYTAFIAVDAMTRTAEAGGAEK